VCSGGDGARALLSSEKDGHGATPGGQRVLEPSRHARRQVLLHITQFLGLAVETCTSTLRRESIRSANEDPCSLNRMSLVPVQELPAFHAHSDSGDQELQRGDGVSLISKSNSKQGHWIPQVNGSPRMTSPAAPSTFIFANDMSVGCQLLTSASTDAKGPNRYLDRVDHLSTRRGAVRSSGSTNPSRRFRLT